MSSIYSHDHDDDCSCTDPNARLSNASLEELFKQSQDGTLDPLSLSPEDIDAKVTYCLQYLQAADVPLLKNGCCTHTMGHMHARFALDILANLAYVLRPASDSPFVVRIVESWPGIWAWLEYAFRHWLVKPILDVGGHSKDSVSGRFFTFSTVVSAMRSFVKLPPICDLLLADDRRTATYVMLGSCWLFEGEQDYKEGLRNDHLLSAAEPLLDLTTYKPGPPPDLFFNCLMSNDAQHSAPVALDHLAWYLNTPTPWSPPAIFMLDYHLRMVGTMIIAHQYADAILAQHAVRSVTRILVALTSTTYDETTATGIAQAIASALAFLSTAFPSTDGYAWVTHAIQIGLLPAMLRAQQWMGDLPEDRDAAESIKMLLRTFSLYTPFASVLRPLVLSLSHCTELGGFQDEQELYEQLQELVRERSTQIDTDMRCQNPECRKIDSNNDFLSCSGCFTVQYCSSECQKAHWKSAHRAECKEIQGLRAEGRFPAFSVNSEDYRTARVTAVAEIARRKADILSVWRADPPASSAGLSLTVDFNIENPRGVISVGPPEQQPGYAEKPDLRANWDLVVSNGLHTEHVVVALMLPWGRYVGMYFMWIGISSRVETHGSAVERLIQSVEAL
uniref:phytol kinase n=1 Tax=Mycena chlorophos TaxID=658473 RepID=A0ABQ0KX04_MYCCL|nr:predicted protein [Mycena chlorophos]